MSNNLIKYLGVMISCIWRQPYFGIAAILASDTQLGDDYKSGNVYTAFLNRCVQCSVANITELDTECLSTVKLVLNSFLSAEDSKKKLPAGKAQNILAFAEHIYAPVFAWQQEQLDWYQRDGCFTTEDCCCIPSERDEFASGDDLSPVRAYEMEMKRIACYHIIQHVANAGSDPEAVVTNADHGLNIYTPLESVAQVLPLVKSAMEEAQTDLLGAGFPFDIDFQISTVYKNFSDKKGGWPIIWQRPSLR